ncbi:MAG: hypothetical protein E7266_00980 [Lachnospiraceae bacterium]|nr:hypothetical protein [Lachnospiraceae bacterium]
MSKVTLDLYKCMNYASQINDINRRIKSLDRAIYDLYDEIGWGNHRYLKNVDFIINESATLAGCSNYLSTTGDAFTKLQDKLYLKDISELTNYSAKNIAGEILGSGAINNGISVFSSYADLLKTYIGLKVDSYTSRFSEYENAADVVVGWYDWFMNDLKGDFDTVKTWGENIVEEYTYKIPELLPEGINDFFEYLDDGEIIIDTVKGYKEYKKTGDLVESFDDVAFDIFGGVVKDVVKWSDKMANLKYLGVDKLAKGVLVSTIIEMPQNWLEGIKEYAENGTGTAGSIFVDTTVGAAVDVASGVAAPAYLLGTAVTYPVVDQVCETFGYDLSGEYERLTGETGLTAVFKAQKELWVDVVYEGAKDKMADAVDKFYDVAGNAWDSWKSGIKLMFD